MKAVLMSIQPRWCEKIASGEKTIEVRKTRPKLETPFKVYIYCTKDGLVIYGNGKQYITDSCEFLKGSAVEAFENSSGFYKWNGKVIGEFVCDEINEFEVFENGSVQYWNWHNLQKSCLTYGEIADYVGCGKTGYGWHITDIKIYDKPKELSEFYRAEPKPREAWTDSDMCCHCKYHKWIGSMQKYVEKGEPMREKCTLGKPEPICEYTPPISRPPQSWCYVEELQNG